MASLTWTLQHSTDNWDTVVNTISDWQTASFNRGKRSMFDPPQGGGGVIVGRNPLTQPAFAIGDQIRIIAQAPGGGAAREMIFFVSDYEIEYGKTSNEDYWTLNVEDYYAFVGRRPYTGSWSGGTTVGQAIGQILNVNPASIGALKTNFSSLPVSAQSFTNANRLQILNTLVNSSYVTLYTWRDSDLAGSYGLTGLPRPSKFNQNPLNETPPKFTDSQPSPAVDIAFDQLKFGSLTESYYDKVTVIPDGLAAQTAGAGEQELILNTYNQNTTDALNLAQYVLSTQSNAFTSPVEISALFEAQPSNTSMQKLLLLGTVDYSDIRSCLVNFRSVEYPIVVIGEQWSINPAQTRVTYYLFNGANYNFLVLDDALFGKLDENKLGW